MKAALLLDTRRCELCPQKDAPAGCAAIAPDRVAPRFDTLVRSILAA
jgi:hypothetical protein